MEIQHCARAENTSKLSFVKAYCSQKSLPYTFRAVAGGRFSSSSSYGILELDSFSGIGATQEGSEEREYVARLFYLNQTVAVNEIHIHMVVTWNDDAHITVVKKEYLQEKLALPGSDLLVDFEAEEIKLDVPQKGVTLDEGWTVTPLIPPVISKKHVDSYQPLKRIPHCELSAEFETDTADAKVTPLRYQVKLLGAREPYNMFTIKPPFTGVGNATNRSSLGQSSSTKRPLQMSSLALVPLPKRKHTSTYQQPQLQSQGYYALEPGREQSSTYFLQEAGPSTPAQRDYVSNPRPQLGFVYQHRLPLPHPVTRVPLESLSYGPLTHVQPPSRGAEQYPRITSADIAARVGVSLESLSSMECSRVILLDLAKFCVDWKLIGRRLGLTDGEITAIDSDHKKEEEKRVGMVERWKDKFAYRATYLVFIEALLAIGMTHDAIESMEVIGAALSD